MAKVVRKEILRIRKKASQSLGGQTSEVPSTMDGMFFIIIFYIIGASHSESNKIIDVIQNLKMIE